MKQNFLQATAAVFLGLAATLLCTCSAGAADKIWGGGGPNGFWGNPANWAANVAPVAADSLFFTGTVRVNNTNDFGGGTAFNGITFSTPAGAFNLQGSAVTLGGGITNSQVVTLQTMSLPLTLSATRNVSVANSALLTLGGVISGTGAGLTKTEEGLLTLAAANTFDGGLAIQGGTVTVGSDANLGAAPGTATPGSISINGSNGTLRSTASFTLNAKRGIALGPTSGTGQGRIEVTSGTTLSYGGILANNGGSGGLTKDAFGGLTLSGANTYSGATAIKVGTLTLDFTQSTAPVNNIINPVSALTLGGANAGFGATNFAALIMNGKASTVNAQAFNGTLLTFGGSVIRASSGSGGAANLALGSLTHNPGGVLVMVPPTFAGGSGNITTTATNINGMLGGFATVGDGSSQQGIVLGTNFASVDVSGNVVNFTGYRVLNTGESLHSFSTAATTISIPSTVTGDMLVDADNANTLTDVNSINWNRTDNNVTLKIGTGNTLRLGRYGCIFKPNTASGLTWLIGQTPAGGNSPDQNIGTLTAGGADNTAGEIIVDVNNTSSSSGTLIIDAQITDNGTGPVTFVKTGVGSMKLRGHNTHSGGTYLLQGRVQFVGGEGGVGTGNADAGGTGPIYILPGCYLFPSGTGPATPVTNAVFIAGNGTSGEPLGAIRTTTGWLFNGPWTLIGDTTIGGNGGVSGAIASKLSGPYAVTLCSPVTVNGTVSLSNPGNDWSGTTTLTARLSGGTAGSVPNTFVSGASEIIPNGFGKGNVVMAGGSQRTITWDMNGFSETVNGLAHSGTAVSCIILNNGTTPSTLTVGDNDQSGTFGGILQDGSSTVALTKIGGGALTLSGVGTYSGPTTVNGGTLAVSSTGSIASSPVQVNSGGTLDVSDVAGTTTFNSISVNGGTVVAQTTGPGAITSLSLSGAHLRALTLNTATPNLQATTLTTVGATNYIDIVAIGFITGYPAQFPVIKYTGTVGGAGNNFAIGSVPRADTKGFVSNNVANGSIDIVLTAGPKTLSWTGANSNDWDIGVTTNWLAFGVTPVAFQNIDAVFFDDSSSVNAVNLTTTLLPSGISMTNQTRNYSFVGSGSISGLGRLIKDGVGSLTIANTGVNDFTGGIVLAGGTLQVGNNSTGGNLPGGSVINNGALVFSRSDNLAETLNISGTGTVSQNGPGILTLGGTSSYQGLTTVAQGTLKAASATAFGSNTVAIVVNSGGTLDVGGQALTGKPLTVSGAGVGGGGAIINTGADQQNALLNVSMSNHTTFGGAGRWDIRGTGASLDTGGNAYNLSKVGTNQVSLVGVTVDTALANISVQAGTLSVETTTSSLGNPANTLTVSAGATLQFYGTTTPWEKLFALNGDGITTTINVPNGADNTIQGAITLAGNCIFNNGASGNNLTLNGAISGSGGLIKTGGAFLMLNGVGSYAGNTTVNGGILVLNNNLIGGGVLSNAVGTAISGQATNTGPVRISGALLPGGTNVAGFFGSGALTLNAAQLILDLGQPNASFVIASDQIVANGPLVATGTNQITLVPGSPGNLTNGQVITIIRYTGGSPPAAANFSLQGAPAGYAFSLVDPATTPNAVQVRVDSAPQVLAWNGGAVASPTAWDIRTTPNWLNTRDNSTTTFTNADSVMFSDTANTNRVTLAGTLMPAKITFNNSAVTYTLDGAGKLSGTAPLDMNGGGMLILANSGTNDFSGAVNIPSGILQVGIGGTNGNLGTGPVTNYGALVFNRAGNLTNVGVIAGSGTVSNIGPGVVTLSAANFYDGETVIAQGTLKAGNSGAFGAAASGTTVQLGASLDIGGQALTNEPVTVIGAGVSSQGAIINSGAAQQNALASVTLTGDTTFGGTGRWDIRAAVASLSTSGQAFNLTKVGTNSIWLVNVSVDPALANVNVQAGTLGYQDNTLGLGNPASTLTIAAGATLGFLNSVAALDKVITLNGTSTNTTVDVGGGTVNTIIGAVTLNGGCILSCPGTNALAFNGPVLGTGSLTKTGFGTVSLNGTNSYAGNTTVNGGTLALTGGAVLTNSPVITVAAGVLDVTGLAVGPTLTLRSGQTLAGNGSVNGSLLAQFGSTVSLGPPVGVLTVSNTATLQGNSVMELDRSTTNKSDRLNAAAVNLGGTLTVTNIGPALQSGDTFTLFSGTLSGTISVSPASLPPLAPGLSWDTSSLNSLGRISVTGSAIAAPKITGASVAGGNFKIAASGGQAGATCRVVASTNVASPLNTWIPVITNTFDSNGNLNVSIPINPNVSRDFYRVVAP